MTFTTPAGNPAWNSIHRFSNRSMKCYYNNCYHLFEINNPFRLSNALSFHTLEPSYIGHLWDNTMISVVSGLFHKITTYGKEKFVRSSQVFVKEVLLTATAEALSLWVLSWISACFFFASARHGLEKNPKKITWLGKLYVLSVDCRRKSASNGLQNWQTKHQVCIFSAIIVLSCWYCFRRKGFQGIGNGSK